MKQEDYCISLGQAEGSNGDGRYSESQTFCSEHFHPSRFTRPSFPYFGQDLGTRLGVRTENEANGVLWASLLTDTVEIFNLTRHVVSLLV